MKRFRPVHALVAIAISGIALLNGQFTDGAQAAPSTVSPSGLYAAAGTGLSMIPEVSEVRYRMIAHKILQPTEEVVCRTQSLVGGLVIGPDGILVPDQSKIVVDQRAFHCTSARADALLQATLETGA